MNAQTPRILVVGTVDTKRDEIGFLCAQVRASGGLPLVMDVGVLGAGDNAFEVAFSNHAVAAAAGQNLAQVRESGDENSAMQAMARGASLLAARAHADKKIDGLLALGGTMGTDLALDVASSLPLGVPKLLLSTVAFSPLIAPERMPPDLTMMLWAGGLYGLNSLCRATLAQAAGAVVGACRAAESLVQPGEQRPVVGMTSLGSSALKYMTCLKPALEQRGFELAVFHTTGMGGRAFEALANQGFFACVMDFSLQEFVNHLAGSVVSAGPDRLRGAGEQGVPQIVAPGATDMVDFPALGAMPVRFAGRAFHAHNRLIASVSIDAAMRAEVAQELAERLRTAKGPVHLMLPLQGIEEWDRPGAPLHDPEGLQAFVDAMRECDLGAATLQEIDAHINDAAFAEQVLVIFDQWLARGLIARPKEAGHG